MPAYKNEPFPPAYKTGPDYQRSAAFDNPAYRTKLLAHAAREALLDIVWSNVEIPRHMKAQIQPGLSQSSFSKTRDAERVLLGADMIPRSAPPDMDPEQARAQYGLCDGFISDKEFEQYGRQHLLRQYGHFLYSDDELPKMAPRVRAAGADEKTFGLLETLRVERRIGLAMGEQLDWRDFYPRSEAEQMEPSLRPLFHWLREGWRSDSGLSAEMEAKFKSFYERVIMASDSAEVMELAKEWRDELFPEAQQEQSQGQEPPDQPDESENGEPGEGEGQPGAGEPGEGRPGGKAPKKGQPGSGSGPGSPGEGEPGEPDSHDAGGEPASAPGAPSDGKRQNGAPRDADPLDIGKGPAKPAPTPSGMPGMLEEIVSGLKEAPKPAASGGSKSGEGKGEGGEKGSGAKPGAGPAIDIDAPSDAEAKSARGHAFSKGSSDGSDSEPVAGEWGVDPANEEILAGSTDFYQEGHFSSAGGGSAGRGRAYGRGLGRIDEERVSAVTRVIEKMFTGKARAVASDTPSKKMSVRHMARNEVKYIRKEDYSRGKMFVDMVVDCSGSMGGEPIESARHLIAALSDLAVKNLVSGRVIFSSGEGWMACELPMKRERIAGIQAFSGSEGIKKALYDNALKLRVADAVFVFTDAEITDESFDKTQLSARKIEPLGLYVGGPEADRGMSRYFDRYIIRESLQELALGMVQRFMMQKKETAKTQQKKARLRGG